MKYRMYIDEVGSSDMGSSDHENHRFLSLTGVIVEIQYVADVVFPEMEILKSKFFRSHPDDPVIFHRSEMVNRKGPFEAPKRVEVQQEFDRALLAALSRWDYRVLTVCIDKRKHQETYKVWKYDPYHYCLAVLMERFVLFLDGIDGSGDAMAESRGGKEDRRLKTSYENLVARGSEFLTSERFMSRLTSRQLKVKSKQNNVSGLQLADLIAHPSRNEILHANGLLQRPVVPFARQVISILQAKYYQEGPNIYGRKFIG